MVIFLAHFLIVLAAWTITIKFLFPVSFALWQGVPVTSYIYWDFWWAIHLWLAWALLHWPRYTYVLALSVGVVETIIIVTKFVIFLTQPEWDIWNTNWFINKIFVLLCFLLVVFHFTLNRRRVQQYALKMTSTEAGTGA